MTIAGYAKGGASIADANGKEDAAIDEGNGKGGASVSNCNGTVKKNH